MPTIVTDYINRTLIVLVQFLSCLVFSITYYILTVYGYRNIFNEIVEYAKYEEIQFPKYWLSVKLLGSQKESKDYRRSDAIIKGQWAMENGMPALGAEGKTMTSPLPPESE